MRTRGEFYQPTLKTNVIASEKMHLTTFLNGLKADFTEKWIYRKLYYCTINK